VSKPSGILVMLRNELRGEGVRVSHRNQGQTGEYLMVMLPIGRSIFLFSRDNELLMNSRLNGDFKYSMNLADPQTDPMGVIEMFKKMANAQVALISKCKKL
jgi:hypothetical protein